MSTWRTIRDRLGEAMTGRSPQFWRDRAEEARVHAELTTDQQMKDLWLRIAEGHERQAALLQRVLSSLPVSGSHPVADIAGTIIPSHPMSTYSVRYKSGKILAVGRSEQDANEIAQHVANFLGESMWIFAETGNAHREVPPEMNCKGRCINAGD